MASVLQMVLDEWQHDAAWKKIQQNTFTRWVNQHLKPVNDTVTDLETDFEEGLKLIRLVEVLSGKSVGRYNKKVTFHSQKLENISLALEFLEKEENIKLVNIDGSAIVNRNLKLILGLVWTLILHYSISKQVWDGQSSDALENQDLPPKIKLMTWLKEKLPVGLPFSNFTSDWNDGILLGALVDSCAPDLEVGWRNWVPAQALQSTTTAMKLANDHLDVAALITPEELINPAVDEKSVMTYLAQFPGAKYTPPLGRFLELDNVVVVGCDTKLTLKTRSSAVAPEVIIRGPDGSSLQYSQEQVSNNVYVFKFKPILAGEHEIMAAARDRASGDSAQLESAKIIAVDRIRLVYEDNTECDKPIVLKVLNAGRVSSIEILVTAPNGEEIVVPAVIDDAVYKGQFTPKHEGIYKINIFQKGVLVADSPYTLRVISQGSFSLRCAILIALCVVSAVEKSCEV
ncbi:unnamed protein product [Gongylonema pulchrum]|uniref:Calponin-homology (CH) domain-containing protein n=1 Tax=Gongylonema pulchrum TaxID=637853 RepID=A0A183DP88_9BILA|nr:unnamed protein product [Gongylonema pulchrum]